MKDIFEQGEFSEYRINDLQNSMGVINESFAFFEEKVSVDFFEEKVSVFISHKHDDLDDLKGIIGFLEKNFNVIAYIDSRDLSMPKITSGETAEKIKDRIKKCKRFILLATNGAVESKWCNWELGFADAIKGKNAVLFPMKEKGSNYKGNEYMEIYSYITYFDGSEKNDSGKKVKEGYYVMTKSKNKRSIISLSSWLKE